MPSPPPQKNPVSTTPPPRRKRKQLTHQVREVAVHTAAHNLHSQNGNGRYTASQTCFATAVVIILTYACFATLICPNKQLPYAALAVVSLLQQQQPVLTQRVHTTVQQASGDIS